MNHISREWDYQHRVTTSKDCNTEFWSYLEYIMEFKTDIGFMPLLAQTTARWVEISDLFFAYLEVINVNQDKGEALYPY